MRQNEELSSEKTASNVTLDKIEARAENWTLFANAHERDELSSWFWDDDVVKALHEVRIIKSETALLIRAVRQLGALVNAWRFKDDYDASAMDALDRIDPDVLELLEGELERET